MEHEKNHENEREQRCDCRSILRGGSHLMRSDAQHIKNLCNSAIWGGVRHAGGNARNPDPSILSRDAARINIGHVSPNAG